MNPSPTEELLGCPFCGSEPSTYRRLDESLWSHAVVEHLTITCTECDCALISGEEHDRIRAAWNTRTAQPPLPGGIPETLTAEQAWQDLVEKDDRTSPSETPDMALITIEELRDYMASALSSSRPAPTQELRPSPRDVRLLAAQYADTLGDGWKFTRAELQTFVDALFALLQRPDGERS